MPLESITYIPDLVASNPTTSDGLVQGDDHLRGIKAALRNTLPNWTSAALQATQAALDGAVASVTGLATTLFPLGTAALPSITPIGDPNTGIYSPGADQVGVAVGGVQAIGVNADKSVDLKGAATIAGALTVTGAVAAHGAGFLPIGAPLAWLSDTLPDSSTWGTYGWMNGQAVSRTTYATAFALLGTTYGTGDGSTTFNLPDWRETVPVGKSTMGGTSARGLLATLRATFASVFGAEKVAIAQTDLPNVTIGSGTIAVASSFGGMQGFPVGSSVVTGGGGAGVAPNNASLNAIVATNTVSGSTASINGGVAQTSVDKMQPSQVCNWIIRLL